jgi:hypothetical protein
VSIYRSDANGQALGKPVMLGSSHCDDRLPHHPLRLARLPRAGVRTLRRNGLTSCSDAAAVLTRDCFWIRLQNASPPVTIALTPIRSSWVKWSKRVEHVV